MNESYKDLANALSEVLKDVNTFNAYDEELDESQVDDLKAVSELNKQLKRLLDKAPEHRNLQEERAFWAHVEQMRKQREKLFRSNF